jgi:hypothetical protein
LDASEDLRQGLMSLVVEEAAHIGIRMGFLGWLARRSRWQQAGLVMGVIVLLVLPTAFSIRESSRLRAELDQMKAAAAGYEQAAHKLEEDLQAAKQQLAEQRVQPDLQGKQPAAGTDVTSSPLTEPQINTPIFVLTALRAADPSQLRNDLVLSLSSPWIVFSLELEGAATYEKYRATLRQGNGRVLWRGQGLEPNRYDALTIGFPSKFLPAGNYLLSIEGLAGDGRPIPVAEYSVRVMEKK